MLREKMHVAFAQQTMPITVISFLLVKSCRSGLPPRQHGAVAAEERYAQVWFSELQLLQALLH